MGKFILVLFFLACLILPSLANNWEDYKEAYEDIDDDDRTTKKVIFSTKSSSATIKIGSSTNAPISTKSTGAHKKYFRITFYLGFFSTF